LPKRNKKTKSKREASASEGKARYVGGGRTRGVSSSKIERQIVNLVKGRVPEPNRPSKTKVRHKQDPAAQIGKESRKLQGKNHSGPPSEKKEPERSRPPSQKKLL